MRYFITARNNKLIKKSCDKLDHMYLSKLIIEARKYHIFKTEVAKYKLTKVPKNLALADISEAIQENIYLKHMRLIRYCTEKMIYHVLKNAYTEVKNKLAEDSFMEAFVRNDRKSDDSDSDMDLS